MSAQRSTDVLDDHAAIEPRLAADQERTIKDVEVVDFVAEIQDLARAQAHKARTGTTEEGWEVNVSLCRVCACVRVCQ